MKNKEKTAKQKILDLEIMNDYPDQKKFCVSQIDKVFKINTNLCIAKIPAMHAVTLKNFFKVTNKLNTVIFPLNLNTKNPIIIFSSEKQRKELLEKVVKRGYSPEKIKEIQAEANYFYFSFNFKNLY